MLLLFVLLPLSDCPLFALLSRPVPLGVVVASHSFLLPTFFGDSDFFFFSFDSFLWLLFSLSLLDGEVDASRRFLSAREKYTAYTLSIFLCIRSGERLLLGRCPSDLGLDSSMCCMCGGG